jgi:hypothetical protein
MSEQKTHYRKAFNSPYLGSADIVEPQVFTTSHVALEPHKVNKKAGEFFNTCYFKDAEIRPGEKMKPMILNATNSKMMAELSGSKFIDDWGGIRLMIYVDPNVKQIGGGTGDGLRIRPAPQRQAIVPGSPLWEGAKRAFARDGNLDKVKAKADISPENENLLMQEIMDA